jgi:hypothetical protein
MDVSLVLLVLAIKRGLINMGNVQKTDMKRSPNS